MAFHTIKDFAAICGVAPQYIRTYIKRGKLKKTKSKHIDDTNPFNRDFLIAKTGSAIIDSSKIPKPKPKAEKSKKPSTPKKVDSVPSPDLDEDYEDDLTEPIDLDDESANFVDDDGQYKLDQRKKRLEILKLQEDIEIKRIQKDKLNGELIPTELVTLIFTQHFKSINATFKQSMDNFIVDISLKHKFTAEDIAAYKGLLIAEINKAVKEGVAESKRNVNKIVDEYSEKRGKGERKV